MEKSCQGKVLYSEEKSLKDLRYLGLWDLYHPLLTETQSEICELYYSLDLSLAEIAEQKGITRQAVSETLKKSRELLDGYEEKLHHFEQNQSYSLEVSFMMTDVIKALEDFKQLHPEFTAEMEGIEKLVTVGETVEED